MRRLDFLSARRKSLLLLVIQLLAGAERMLSHQADHVQQAPPAPNSTHTFAWQSSLCLCLSLSLIATNVDICSRLGECVNYRSPKPHYFHRKNVIERETLLGTHCVQSRLLAQTPLINISAYTEILISQFAALFSSSWPRQVWRYI